MPFSNGRIAVDGPTAGPNQVEGLRDVLCEHRFYVTQRCVAGRADDHEAGLRELLGALGAHEEADIGAGLVQSSTEIATDGACTND